MATARRGNGVSLADKMRREAAKTLQGDVAANWGNLDERTRKYFEGIFGGTTKIQPRESRKMSSEQLLKQKIALLPFGTTTPATPPSGTDAVKFYYLAYVTNNTVGVLKTCPSGDYKAEANWRTEATYTGDDTTVNRTKFWPAQIKVSYTKKAAGGGSEMEIVTTFDGRSEERAITHSATCPFGSGTQKFDGIAPEEADVATAVMGALKCDIASKYRRAGCQYIQEFINISSASSAEDYNETLGSTPAFT
ncbi:hypothetical protein [Roseofilum sp. Belize Diploria]|uniref:hypothetical protein n=1 Tax=Roseofilum sp. Belize Diploria TaxID=2821501 RepID=UPI001B059747|nr:hypothetical protein [Roseofilum sp. Belize Diploria]MBP0008053.1 hypothetical protein [Roseofilum sp. Belize Diploria]